VEFVNLDDGATRAAAGEDPRAFVRREVKTLVVDEAQLEPALFRAIKAEVDLDRRPGRFLLTGSSRLLAAPDFADSLVGRVEPIELWPFSAAELASRQSHFIDDLFVSPSKLLRSGSSDRADLIARVCTGGFPEAVARAGARRDAWFRSYVKTSVTRVVEQLADIERAAEIPRLLRLCAARTATELNTAAIASDFAVPVRTVNGYLAHLETAFFIQLVPAWSTNVSSKVVRRPKLVLVDSGLAAHLIGATPQSLAKPTSTWGPLLETYVSMELRKLASVSESRPSMFHFRDRDGAEVDIVLEHPDGRIVGIEVKATSTVRSEDFRGLRYLGERLGDRFAYGVLLTAAPEATPFGPKMAALPLDVLWR